MSRTHNGNPSWTWISLLCINTIFSIVLAFIFNGPLSTSSLAWPDSIGSWFFFSFRFVSFHFISESVCWHKLAFLFLCFMRRCDDVSAKAWRWVRCQKKKRKKKHTLPQSSSDVEQQRRRNTYNFHFVSFRFFVFAVSLCVHCAHFGCERTYQTIGTQCIWEGIVAVRTRLAFNVSVFAFIPDILRNLCASIVNSVAAAVQLTLRICHSKLTSTTTTKNNKHTKWQFSEWQEKRNKYKMRTRDELDSSLACTQHQNQHTKQQKQKQTTTVGTQQVGRHTKATAYAAHTK